MKRLLPMFMLLALFLGQACEGPEGPEGPAGPQGETGATGPQGAPGTPASSTVYDIGGWDFTAADDFQLGIDFAEQDMEVTESDAILVYRLYGAVDENTPIWRMLPETNYLTPPNSTQKVMLTYDFLHTPEQLLIFMDGTVDLTALGTAWTTDQVFRIVVVPGEFAQRTDGTKRKINLKDYNVDYNDYNAVIKYFRLSDKNVRTITLK